MAKSKNHTAHNRNNKVHRNGIFKAKKKPHFSKKGMYPKFKRNAKYAFRWRKAGRAKSEEMKQAQKK